MIKMKRARPCSHVRRVRTKKGFRKVRVNPKIKKVKRSMVKFLSYEDRKKLSPFQRIMLEAKESEERHERRKQFLKEFNEIQDIDKTKKGKTRRSMAFKERTTVPIFDYPDERKFSVERKMVSPDEFMRLAQKGSWDERSRSIPLEKYVEENVFMDLGRIKEGLRSKEELVPTGFIEFDKDGKPVEHEGRHRARAAKELGFKKIPVVFARRKY